MEDTYHTLIIGNEGVRMDLENTATVKDWPVPKCVFDIRSIMRFANFYQRLI